MIVPISCSTFQPESFNNFGKVSTGNILIADYLTPAWTPLFSLVSGVVTEYGGALSHAAIVCREYGIPAVVGVSKLLDRIHDGELVEVDGNTGTLRKKNRTNDEMVSTKAIQHPSRPS